MSIELHLDLWDEGFRDGVILVFPFSIDEAYIMANTV